MSEVVLAIDPGHRKCGVAVVARDRTVQVRQVVPRERLRHVIMEIAASWPPRVILVGDGTHSEAVMDEASALGAPLQAVDETGSSLLGRERYWRANPPRGLWRLVPTSLRVPPEPFDDWVAVLLAERYWDELEGQER